MFFCLFLSFHSIVRLQTYTGWLLFQLCCCRWVVPGHHHSDTCVFSLQILPAFSCISPDEWSLNDHGSYANLSVVVAGCLTIYFVDQLLCTVRMWSFWKQGRWIKCVNFISTLSPSGFFFFFLIQIESWCALTAKKGGVSRCGSHEHARASYRSREGCFALYALSLFFCLLCIVSRRTWFAPPSPQKKSSRRRTKT